MSTRHTAALRALLALGSVLFAVLMAEGALRVWYRGGGSATLGAPGGGRFVHDTIDGQHQRGRLDIGPKTAGVPRIMVVGDSITYGLGIRDWQQTWPELLARALEAAGRPHELAVFAVPGNDIPQHVATMREWAEELAPDLVVYQWYANDIEAVEHRPASTRWWHGWPGHQWLRGASYVYFVLDHRLSQWLPSADRTYVDYLLADFVPGTLEWAEFERRFHEFATRAQAVSKRRIMVLYPQVPFRGTYPLAPIHERMRALAGAAHHLAIPPAIWTRASATLAADSRAPWKQVVQVAPGDHAGMIESGVYTFAGGPLTVRMSMERTSEGDAAAPVGTLQLVDAATAETIAEAELRVDAAAGELCPVTLSFTVPGSGIRVIRFRLRSAGGAGWALADIGVPVNYGFEVIDLAEPLNTFDTHVSAFDAHPNARAQRVIADAVLTALTGSAAP